MNKWIVAIIVPTVFGLILDFFKATNPLFLTVLFTIGIVIPVLLIRIIFERNKRRKEKESNYN